MPEIVPRYEDEIGWVRVDAVLTPGEAEELAKNCERIADELDARRSGDEPSGATKRLTGLGR